MSTTTPLADFIADARPTHTHTTVTNDHVTTHQVTSISNGLDPQHPGARVVTCAILETAWNQDRNAWVTTRRDDVRFIDGTPAEQDHPAHETHTVPDDNPSDRNALMAHAQAANLTLLPSTPLPAGDDHPVPHTTYIPEVFTFVRQGQVGEVLTVSQQTRVEISTLTLTEVIPSWAHGVRAVRARIMQTRYNVAERAYVTGEHPEVILTAAPNDGVAVKVIAPRSAMRTLGMEYAGRYSHAAARRAHDAARRGKASVEA